MPFWYLIYIQQTQLHAKGILDHWGNKHLKHFLITMNYAQKHDLLFPFFIKVVVNKSKAYSFLIICMMSLQKKYNFQLECCDSIFSLLRRELEYINKTEILSSGYHTAFLFSKQQLDVVLACMISILQVFRSLLNCWHTVAYITNFGKRSGSSEGHTLNFCQNLVQYRSRICIKKNPSPGILRWSCLQTKEGQKHSKFHLVGYKIVKCLRHRQYDQGIIEGTIGFVLGLVTALYWSFPKCCTLANKAVGAIWQALLKPPQRRQSSGPLSSNC